MSDPTITLIAPLYRSKGWLKLLGVMSIMIGIMCCLSVVGAIVGWMPIWIGILACQAADSFRRGVEGDNLDCGIEASRKLGTLITVLGILTLLVLIVCVAIVVTMLFAFISGIASMLLSLALLI